MIVQLSRLLARGGTTSTFDAGKEAESEFKIVQRRRSRAITSNPSRAKYVVLRMLARMDDENQARNAKTLPLTNTYTTQNVKHRILPMRYGHDVK